VCTLQDKEENKHNKKRKNKKIAQPEQFPKSNIKIIERGKIDTPNIQINTVHFYNHVNKKKVTGLN
jgi:transposase